MDQVSQTPENALFEINHIEHTASSNTFTVEKAYEITLQGTSPDPDTVTEIGIKMIWKVYGKMYILLQTVITNISAGSHSRRLHIREVPNSSVSFPDLPALRTGAFFHRSFFYGRWHSAGR